MVKSFSSGAKQERWGQFNVEHAQSAGKLGRLSGGWWIAPLAPWERSADFAEPGMVAEAALV
jgi:hypothetical protein